MRLHKGICILVCCIFIGTVFTPCVSGFGYVHEMIIKDAWEFMKSDYATPEEKNVIKQLEENYTALDIADSIFIGASSTGKGYYCDLSSAYINEITDSYDFNFFGPNIGLPSTTVYDLDRCGVTEIIKQNFQDIEQIKCNYIYLLNETGSYKYMIDVDYDTNHIDVIFGNIDMDPYNKANLVTTKFFGQPSVCCFAVFEPIENSKGIITDYKERETIPPLPYNPHHNYVGLPIIGRVFPSTDLGHSPAPYQDSIITLEKNYYGAYDCINITSFVENKWVYERIAGFDFKNANVQDEDAICCGDVDNDTLDEIIYVETDPTDPNNEHRGPSLRIFDFNTTFDRWETIGSWSELNLDWKFSSETDKVVAADLIGNGKDVIIIVQPTPSGDKLHFTIKDETGKDLPELVKSFDLAIDPSEGFFVAKAKIIPTVKSITTKASNIPDISTYVCFYFNQSNNWILKRADYDNLHLFSMEGNGFNAYTHFMDFASNYQGNYLNEYHDKCWYDNNWDSSASHHNFIDGFNYRRCEELISDWWLPSLEVDIKKQELVRPDDMVDTLTSLLCVGDFCETDSLDMINKFEITQGARSRYGFFISTDENAPGYYARCYDDGVPAPAHIKYKLGAWASLVLAASIFYTLLLIPGSGVIDVGTIGVNTLLIYLLYKYADWIKLEFYEDEFNKSDYWNIIFPPIDNVLNYYYQNGLMIHNEIIQENGWKPGGDAYYLEGMGDYEKYKNFYQTTSLKFFGAAFHLDCGIFHHVWNTNDYGHAEFEGWTTRSYKENSSKWNIESPRYWDQQQRIRDAIDGIYRRFYISEDSYLNINPLYVPFRQQVHKLAKLAIGNQDEGGYIWTFKNLNTPGYADKWETYMEYIYPYMVAFTVVMMTRYQQGIDEPLGQQASHHIELVHIPEG